MYKREEGEAAALTIFITRAQGLLQTSFQDLCALPKKG